MSDTYGKKLNAEQLVSFLDHVFKSNDQLQMNGRRITPVLVWGKHGQGKTETVLDYAKKRNWQIAYCAPAQFEEMGDLHGMPKILDPNPMIDGDEITIYSPPSWIPKSEGPGIMVLDDINRADDRILRGVMQLLQNFELLSWKLPPKWQIVATANPDDGNYSVTSMDDAMITRMLHVTLEFDVNVWIKWAIENEIDERGISFVTLYPECVQGRRTTPRSLVHFFDQIKYIADLRSNLEFIHIIADSALDEVTTAAFMKFVLEDLEMLINPFDILESEDWSKTEKKLKQGVTDKSGDVRIDMLAVLFMRLFKYISSKNYIYTDKRKNNLIELMLCKFVPSDLSMSLYLDIMREGSQELKNIVKDSRLSKLMINSM
jgi:hypothetical protein